TQPRPPGTGWRGAGAATRRAPADGTAEPLVVEPYEPRREELASLRGGPDVSITAVGTGADAIVALDRRLPGCVVLNPLVGDATPLDFAKRLLHDSSAHRVPVLVHGDLDGDEQLESIKRSFSGLTVKDVRTDQRLLDQTALYLHRRFADLSAAQRRILSDLHGGSGALGGKKVLIVDDDIRNIFALTSVLEEHHMLVVSAENGRDAVKALQAYSDIDVVLMDIMMPEMDGMETTRQIRRDSRSRHVPIIAVTAKAMKGDREKCIEAGAWDYLAKPVDPEELVAMLRAWLVR